MSRQVTSIALTEREICELREIARRLERTRSDALRYIIRQAARGMGVQVSEINPEAQQLQASAD